MSSGLAVTTRPSRVMTATPTGASSAIVWRRSTPAEPIATTGATVSGCGGLIDAGRARTARRSAGGASARAAANPAARWSRAAAVRRAPSMPGTPRAAARRCATAAGWRRARRAAGGSPHSPDSTTAAPSSCAPDGSNGSARSTPASLRRIVASRCSTAAATGLAATSPGPPAPTAARAAGAPPGLPRHAGAPGPPGKAATPLPVRGRPTARCAQVATSRRRRGLRPVLTSRSVRRAVSLRHHKECHPSVRRQRRSFRSRQRE